MVVWWLASWANLAAWAAVYTVAESTYASVATGSSNTYCYNGICVKSKRDLEKRSALWRRYRDALAAAAGIGALNL
jgi:hypothetical protein